MKLSDSVFEIISQYTDRKWKIDGNLLYPTFDDVDRLLGLMAKELEAKDYDSIESGGILIKRDRDKLDVYVHLGELNEDSSA